MTETPPEVVPPVDPPARVDLAAAFGAPEVLEALQAEIDPEVWQDSPKPVTEALGVFKGWIGSRPDSTKPDPEAWAAFDRRRDDAAATLHSALDQHEQIKSLRAARQAADALDVFLTPAQPGKKPPTNQPARVSRW